MNIKRYLHKILLNEFFVHFYRFDKNFITVRILEHDRNTTTESEVQNFKVSEIIRHGSYSTVNYDNDIALVKVEGEFKFKDGMRPACLPEGGKIANLKI